MNEEFLFDFTNYYNLLDMAMANAVDWMTGIRFNF